MLIPTAIVISSQVIHDTRNLLALLGSHAGNLPQGLRGGLFPVGIHSKEGLHLFPEFPSQLFLLPGSRLQSFYQRTPFQIRQDFLQLLHDRIEVVQQFLLCLDGLFQGLIHGRLRGCFGSVTSQHCSRQR
ncbi:MAG: hypothetical protein R3C12_04580 [Planctomycetaceae bacterium]